MWPNWKGETAVIVASGPSTEDIRLSDARNRARVLVVKENWTLAPWADVLYASDGPWWEQHKGVPEFHGLKFSASPRAAKLFPGIMTVSLASVDRMVLDKPGTLGCGSRFGNGHSGFHALNLVALFGPAKIVLVGFDLTLENGSHWHDKPRMAAATKSLMSEWREALDGCASQLADFGIKVVNASPLSALKNYPKVSFQEAIAGIGDVAQSPRRSNRPRHRVDVEREPVAESKVGDTSGIREGTDRGSETDEQEGVGSGHAIESIR